MTKASTSFNEVLEKAKQVDLEGLAQQIAEAEQSVQQLRDAYRVLQVLIHGRKPRKQRQPGEKRAAQKTTTDGDGILEARIAEFLKHCGIASLVMISQHVAAHHKTVERVLNASERFKRHADGRYVLDS